MTKKEYSELLKSPKWKVKRLEILERDKNECQRCFKRKAKHVHHRYYIDGKLPWEYKNNVYVSLCPYCHEIEHKYKSLKEFINPKNTNLSKVNTPINLKKKRDNNKKTSGYKKWDNNQQLYKSKLKEIAELIGNKYEYKYNDSQLMYNTLPILDYLFDNNIKVFHQYSHKTLINNSSGKQIYISLYLPELNKAIVRKWEHGGQMYWCKLNGIDVLCVEGINDDKINVVLKNFIELGETPNKKEMYIASIVDNELIECDLEFKKNNGRFMYESELLEKREEIEYNICNLFD